MRFETMVRLSNSRTTRLLGPNITRLSSSDDFGKSEQTANFNGLYGTYTETPYKTMALEIRNTITRKEYKDFPVLVIDFGPALVFLLIEVYEICITEDYLTLLSQISYIRPEIEELENIVRELTIKCPVIFINQLNSHFHYNLKYGSAETASDNKTY